MEEKPLAYLIDSLIPEYIKDEYPTYVSFIEKYLQGMETESGPHTVLNEITKFIDVDITPEDTLADFVYQYINSFPIEFLEDINVREFITNAKNFYSQKGNEAAIRFIFNLIEGSISFYYPSLEIFEISNALSTLSGSHKLHDNQFYAYYVYEIVSDLNYIEYEEVVRTMSHPLGERVLFKKIFYQDLEMPMDIGQYTDTFIEQELFLDLGLTDIGERIIVREGLINFRENVLSDIIGDYFFSVTGNTISFYKDLTVKKIMTEEPDPIDITYAVKNSDISFDNATSTINNTNPTTDTDFSVFDVGDVLTISGTTGTTNDGDWTVSALGTDASTINLTVAPTDEAAGSEITIDNDD